MYFNIIYWLQNRTNTTKTFSSSCCIPLHPLPRSKCEMEGVFLLLTYHHQPLPRNLCETEGFSVNTPPPPPPSLETRDGGGVSSVDTSPPTPPSLKLRDGGVICRHTPPPPSLARNARRRGCFLCTRRKPVPMTKGMGLLGYGYG